MTLTKTEPYKKGTLYEKVSKGYLPWAELNIFLTGNFQICCMIQTHDRGILKSSFFLSILIFVLFSCV